MEDDENKFAYYCFECNLEVHKEEKEDDLLHSHKTHVIDSDILNIQRQDLEDRLVHSNFPGYVTNK